MCAAETAAGRGQASAPPSPGFLCNHLPPPPPLRIHIASSDKYTNVHGALAGVIMQLPDHFDAYSMLTEDEIKKNVFSRCPFTKYGAKECISHTPLSLRILRGVYFMSSFICL
jgi:hypothetical protein